MPRPPPRIRLTVLGLAAALAWTLLPATSSLPAGRVVAVLAAAQAGTPGAAAQTRGPILRSRYAVVNTDIMPLAATAADLRPDQQAPVQLSLFGDVSLLAVFDRFEPNARGTTWVGHVNGVADSTVTLVYADGVMTGSVLTPDTAYTIRPASDAPAAGAPGAAPAHIVSQVDQSGYRQEAPPLEIDIPDNLLRTGNVMAADAADTIDLMVVYTPAAAAWAGGTTPIQNLVALGVAETNTSYTSSGVVQQLRLAHVAEVAYVETSNSSTTLSNFRNGVGAFSGIGALRDTYAADLVMLVQKSPASSCGIAYLMTSPGTSFASAAFSVVEADCISPNYTFAHELGHNMGLRHDWYVDTSKTPYSYAHGHVNPGSPGERWRTIMSYNNLCSSSFGFNCTRLLRWSNPTQTHAGAPLGIAAGTSTACAAGSATSNSCDADSRQTLNNTAPYVANFRQGTPGAFAKNSPADGFVTAASSIDLSWQSSPNATSYEYCIDTVNNAACDTGWTSVGTATGTTVGSLAGGSAYHWQVRAVNGPSTTLADSGVWHTFQTYPTANANFVSNGSFGSGQTDWMTFATPSLAYITSQVSGGVLQFFRVPPPAGSSNQAVVLQETGVPLEADAALLAQFDLGNSDDARKRITVLIHDSDFSDLSVCTFWLPASTPLATYSMGTHTTKTWSDATLSFYASTAGSNGGYYLVDNVSLAVTPAQPPTETTCIDPLAPSPGSGSDGPDLMVNGGFTSGTGLAPWSLYGQITQQVAGGVFEFVRPAGTPAGVLLQPTGQAFGAGDVFTTTFELGNSSAVRKRVTVLVHDSDFSDLAACTFWIPSGQVLLPYTMRSYMTQAGTNATLSVYPSTTGPEGWIQLDNVTLRQTPAATAAGTECFEPGSAGADSDVAASSDALLAAPGAFSADDLPATAGWVGAAFEVPIDLTTAAVAQRRFQSWLTSITGRLDEAIGRLPPLFSS